MRLVFIDETSLFRLTQELATDPQVFKRLLTHIANMGCTISEYFHTVLTSYMPAYRELAESGLCHYQHDAVYDRFVKPSAVLGVEHPDIRVVDRMDLLFPPDSLYEEGGFSYHMYEDYFNILHCDYRVFEVEEGIQQNHDQLNRDVEDILELTQQVAKELELRMLGTFSAEQENTYVLFALHNARLWAIVH